MAGDGGNRHAARILHRVVQQRGYGLILGSAMFEDQCGDCHQVRDIGGVRALAGLFAVQPGSIGEGVGVTVGQAADHLAISG
jgi:hypothetical protein